MTNICISYLFGDKDDWRDPNPNIINQSDWVYVLYTDQNIKSDIYHVVKVPQAEHPRFESRKYKLLGASQFYPQHYKKVFHHDANIIVNCDLNELPHFMVMNHPFHWCAYKEIELCKKLGKDNRKTLDDAKEQLKSYNWGKDKGLFAGGLMMRPNTKAVDQFSQDWFFHAKWHTVRDQIFLPYLLDKHGLRPKVVDWLDLIGSKFLMTNHNHKK